MPPVEARIETTPSASLAALSEPTAEQIERYESELTAGDLLAFGEAAMSIGQSLATGMAAGIESLSRALGGFIDATRDMSPEPLNFSWSAGPARGDMSPEEAERRERLSDQIADLNRQRISLDFSLPRGFGIMHHRDYPQDRRRDCPGPLQAVSSSNYRYIPDAVHPVLTDAPRPSNILSVGSEPTRTGIDEGTIQMARARNRQACECGCGEITETGKYKRGHATRVRWQAVKAVVNDGGVIAHEFKTATQAAETLRDKNWRIPASHRTFGIEIECIGSRSAVAAAFASANIPVIAGYRSESSRGAWKITTDSSIRYDRANGDAGDCGGMEIVSPPLHGRKGEKMLERVMNLLSRIGCRVVNSCGSHVHQEARDLNLAGMKLAVSNYNNARRKIDTMVASSRRGISNRYCQPWAGWEIDALNGTQSLTRVSAAQADRYKAVNLHAYGRYGTVEYRQHQGTLNAKKALAWVRFTRYMMDAASRGVAIMAEPASIGAMMTAIKLDQPTITYLVDRTRQLAA